MRNVHQSSERNRGGVQLILRGTLAACCYAGEFYCFGFQVYKNLQSKSYIDEKKIRFYVHY